MLHLAIFNKPYKYRNTDYLADEPLGN